MVLLYDFVIRIYVLAIRMAALFGNQKAAHWINGRKGWRKNIASALKQNEKRVWVHCSSLGEFEQGRPVIEGWRKKFPSDKIVLTFFSPSGYEIRKNFEGADYIFYLPYDSQKNATDFIELIQPEKVFFVKYDFWHHYLTQLNRKQIPVYFISSIFRSSHRYFKWHGGFFRRMLKNVTHFFVQNEESKTLLHSIGYNNVSVTGDTRFDRVIQIASQPKEIEEARVFKNDKPVLVAGSTWHEDEVLLAEVIKGLLETELKFIIVPHEISPHHIGSLEYLLVEKAGLMPHDISLYSYPEKNLSTTRVLIIDTVGLLSSVYRYGEMAYIGGGFDKGIHNTLEAAVYGVPVFFGPYHQKFIEAIELSREGAGFPINTSAELKNLVQHFMNDKNEREKASLTAKNYVLKNGGATEKTLQYFDLKP